MDMCLYLNSNVLSLQAMSKQWKEDWNKDECLRPLFLVFSGFTFSFPIWQICRRCLVWDLNFHLTVQLYSLQTLAAECCTETHWWSSCSKLFCSYVSFNFSQNWIFPQYICPSSTLICKFYFPSQNRWWALRLNFLVGGKTQTKRSQLNLSEPR